MGEVCQQESRRDWGTFCLMPVAIDTNNNCCSPFGSSARGSVVQSVHSHPKYLNTDSQSRVLPATNRAWLFIRIGFDTPVGELK